MKAKRNTVKIAPQPTFVGEVLAERGPKYGVFSTQAAVSQDIKRVMWGTEGWEALSDDAKEAFEMIAVKISRALCGDPNYTDNYVDIAGYATLVADRLSEAPEVFNV